MIRGLLAFAAVCIVFPPADLVARTLVRALAAVGPERWRHAVMLRWQNAVVAFILGVLRVPGGARVDIEASIDAQRDAGAVSAGATGGGDPGGAAAPAGRLIVCNHQSLLDIPAVIRVVRGDWPLFVTRERYRRRIPLVSVMLRLYGHTFVRQGARDPGLLERLARFAARATHPVVVFPEGHRTRDGRPLPWKTAGLRAILGARRWRVHLLVVDGLWRSVSVGEFLRELPRVRGRVVEVGTFDFDPRRDDVVAFVEMLRARQVDALERLRGAGDGPAGEVNVAG